MDDGGLDGETWDWDTGRRKWYDHWISMVDNRVYSSDWARNPLIPLLSSGGMQDNLLFW
jgi:hypothetical protein